jgi:hypothetical protein
MKEIFLQDARRNAKRRRVVCSTEEGLVPDDCAVNDIVLDLETVQPTETNDLQNNYNLISRRRFYTMLDREFPHVSYSNAPFKQCQKCFELKHAYRMTGNPDVQAAWGKLLGEHLSTARKSREVLYADMVEALRGGEKIVVLLDRMDQSKLATPHFANGNPMDDCRPVDISLMGALVYNGSGRTKKAFGDLMLKDLPHDSNAAIHTLDRVLMDACSGECELYFVSMAIPACCSSFEW